MSCRLIYLLALGIMLSACKKSDPDPSAAGPSYVILSNNGFRTKGALYVYSPASSDLATMTYKQKGADQEAFSDLLIENANIYAVTRLTKTVDYVNSKSYTVDQSARYSKELKNPMYQEKHMAIGAGKLFVSDMIDRSDISLLDKPASIKAFDQTNPSKVDSVGVLSYGMITSVAISGDKLFVGHRDYFTDEIAVTVFDANTYTVIKKILFTSTIITRLNPDKDGTIIGLQFSGRLFRISPTDFSVTNLASIASQPWISNAGVSNTIPFEVDTETNKLYYINSSPLGGAVLSVYDLSSNTSADLFTKYTSGHTLALDKTNKLLLVGDYNYNDFGSIADPINIGALKIYSLTGELKKKIVMPFVPEKIVVKY